MTQHTPGPWHIEQAPGGNYRNKRTIASSVYSTPGITDGRDCIADLSAESEQQVEANARLIAAAPDLLKALQDATFALCTVEPTVEVSAAKFRAKTAIAKAIGESNGSH